MGEGGRGVGKESGELGGGAKSGEGEGEVETGIYSDTQEKKLRKAE